MNIVLVLGIIGLLAILALLGVIVWLLVRKGKAEPGSETEKALLTRELVELRAQVENKFHQLDGKLSDSQKTVQSSVKDQLNASQALMSKITDTMTREIGAVQKQLTETAAASKQVLDISTSLQNLEKVLKNQKQRGSLGEAGLQLILENVLPPETFQMQYGFKNGEIVDAVIHAGDGLIPIDSKFSLDNYQRLLECENEQEKATLERAFRDDLKKRIDETAKYIRPEEGTLNVALMYIPAEGIYYDLLINRVSGTSVNTRNLIEYAHADKKVIIVSPTTLLAYLHTILHGYRAFKLEKSVEHVRQHALNLGRHMKAFEEYHQKLGKTLSTTVGHYNETNKKLRLLDKDVTKITNAESEGIEELQLERPSLGGE